MNRPELKYQPQVFENGWYCACGAFHPKEEDTVYCSECGCDRILLQNALNTLLQPEPPGQTEMEMPLSAPAPRSARCGGRAYPHRGCSSCRPGSARREPTRVMGAPVYRPNHSPVQPAQSLPVVLDARCRAPYSGSCCRQTRAPA